MLPHALGGTIEFVNKVIHNHKAIHRPRISTKHQQHRKVLLSAGWTFRRNFEHAKVFIDVEKRMEKMNYKSMAHENLQRPFSTYAHSVPVFCVSLGGGTSGKTQYRPDPDG